MRSAFTWEECVKVSRVAPPAASLTRPAFIINGVRYEGEAESLLAAIEEAGISSGGSKTLAGEDEA